ncbi:hypothetical protein E7811_00170 [Aliigemmobacter aestuarii]|uniref:Uncharacterized protein n=1 Tax=Aliigemmobacter aestuarii TaxID=1445661 RepID=A0A4S3MR02_9RHOB|nr:hypothetical protein [Gemmobacter aestuarii]THD84215.1 hypothetical protein E7811_00170 [Gemmobacter aestuarii]
MQIAANTLMNMQGFSGPVVDFGIAVTIRTAPDGMDLSRGTQVRIRARGHPPRLAEGGARQQKSGRRNGSKGLGKHLIFQSFQTVVTA